MVDSGKPFVVWQQHWVGYKPRKFDTFATLAEAEDAAEKLNASPSGKWFHYLVGAVGDGR